MPHHCTPLPPIATYTEDQLVALLKEGSRDAYNHLYKNYSAVLFGVILRVMHDESTAQDVLQEAFVKIWHNIAAYQPAKGRLYTWMLNVTRNTAIDKLRSKGEIMKSKIHTGEDVVYDIQNIKGTQHNTDTIGLRKMVADMKPDWANIVELAYYKGFTLDEISKTLSIPLGTVKTRMRAAIQHLRTTFTR